MSDARITTGAGTTVAQAEGPGTSSERLGVLLVFLSAMTWSIGGTIGRFVQSTDSWTVVFWRSVWAAAFLIGFMLDAGFYGDQYWIEDPWAYRLPPAYGPYRWVRYYNDCLLVDIDTGQVVDVLYNVFW